MKSNNVQKQRAENGQANTDTQTSVAKEWADEEIRWPWFYCPCCFFFAVRVFAIRRDFPFNSDSNFFKLQAHTDANIVV